MKQTVEEAADECRIAIALSLPSSMRKKLKNAPLTYGKKRAWQK